MRSWQAVGGAFLLCAANAAFGLRMLSCCTLKYKIQYIISIMLNTFLIALAFIYIFILRKIALWATNA
jgi:hypothetical protein